MSVTRRTRSLNDGVGDFQNNNMHRQQRQQHWISKKVLILAIVAVVTVLPFLFFHAQTYLKVLSLTESDPPPAPTTTTKMERSALMTRSTNHNKKKDSRPYFILHLGPAKTGTTSLQCLLQEMAEKGILQRDNYHVLETQSCRPITTTTSITSGNETNSTSNKQVPIWEATYENVQQGTAFMPRCIQQWKPNMTKMPTCWQESYGRYLDEHSNQNIVVSTETMGKVLRRHLPYGTSFVQAFCHDAALSQFQIIVVVTYRHWFEFITSRYIQTLSRLGFHRKYGPWPPLLSSSSRKKGDGKATQTLQEHWTRILQDLNRSQERRGILYYDYLDTFQEIFHDKLTIEIVNFHHYDMTKNDDDENHQSLLVLEQDFICHAMKDTPSSCSFIMEQAKTKQDKKHTTASIFKNQRQQYNIQWFDDLAVEAYRRGLIPKSQTRAVTGRITAQRYYSNFSSNNSVLLLPPPLVIHCPPMEFLDQIYNTSLIMMKKVLPFHQHVSMEEHHQKSFQMALDEKIFCHLDAVQTLDHWMMTVNTSTTISSFENSRTFFTA